jgi:hypothetical protein
LNGTCQRLLPAALLFGEQLFYAVFEPCGLAFECLETKNLFALDFWCASSFSLGFQQLRLLVGFSLLRFISPAECAECTIFFVFIILPG